MTRPLFRDAATGELQTPCTCGHDAQRHPTYHPYRPEGLPVCVDCDCNQYQPRLALVQAHP